MIIKVTQKHIDYGSRCNGQHCPVANAIKGAIGQNAYHVVVGAYTLALNNKKYALPKEVTEFIHAFDANGDVKPFEFELPIVLKKEAK